MSNPISAPASGQDGVTILPQSEVERLWENPKPIPPRDFPDTHHRSDIVPCTIANLEFMLDQYGASVRYDVIRKKTEIVLPGWDGTMDNADNVAMAYVTNMAAVNNMHRTDLDAHVLALGDRNQHNPVAEWITSRPWDGVDRLPAICATLVTEDGFPVDLKNTLIRRWLLSAVAAAMTPKGFRSRGVLTLQGRQGLGKTQWVNALVPDLRLREMFVKSDHHLDGHDKDSITGAICHWIVEIGEVDSSFAKDVARLKGVLTRDSDKVRRPYQRTASEYPRRTVFAATVNDPQFLVDRTGNSRWLTLPLIHIDYEHGIDMQQVFAQLHADFLKGEQWWLTSEEEARLNDTNRHHQVISFIRERLLEILELDEQNGPDAVTMTTTELLNRIGIDKPRNGQNKECADILRELGIVEKKHRRGLVWAVTFRKDAPVFTKLP